MSMAKSKMQKLVEIIVKKQYMMPMCIFSVLAAGSSYSNLNDHYGVTYKLNWLSTEYIDWYRFLIKASVMIGILPAILYEKFGPRLTFFIGAILLLVSQILSVGLLAAVIEKEKL